MRELFSNQVEQAVLGAMMFKPVVIDDVSEIVKYTDFYVPANRAVCKAIYDIHNSGGLVDQITVSEWFNGKSDAGVVDLSYIIDIALNTPSSVGVINNARKVAGYAKEREFMVCADNIKEVFVSEEGTTEERIAQAEALFTSLSSEQQSETQATLKEALKDYVEHLDWRFNNPGVHGVLTGYEDIDERIKGWRAGQLILLAATPGAGKTTYATNVAMNAARAGKHVHIFSLEMAKHELVQRMVACQGAIPLDQLQSAQALSNQDYAGALTPAVACITKMEMTIDDQAALDISQIFSRARRQKRKGSLDLIVIDYLQLIKDRTANGRYEEVSSVSRKLKQLAKEMECPVLALSQLNRQVMNRNDKRPILSDLRESGQLEQDADIIQFLYREEVYDPDTPNKGVCEVITRKFRDGEPGTDYLTFEGRINRMSNTKFRPQDIESPKAYSYT